MLVITIIIYIWWQCSPSRLWEEERGREVSAGLCLSSISWASSGERWSSWDDYYDDSEGKDDDEDGNEDGLCCFWVEIWFQRGQKEQSCPEVSDYIDFANACAHRCRVKTNTGSMILKKCQFSRLVHKCTIYLCCMDQYRNPNMNSKDHRVVALFSWLPKKPSAAYRWVGNIWTQLQFHGS